jgi:hypothetical protein
MVSTRQPSRVQRRRARTAKSCGPGARSWRQARGGASSQPGCERHRSTRRRGQESSSPRGEHEVSRKPSRREGRDVPASPVVHPCAFPCHGPRVPAGARPSLRPLALEGARRQQDSGRGCRESVEVCLVARSRREMADCDSTALCHSLLATGSATTIAAIPDRRDRLRGSPSGTGTSDRRPRRRRTARR